MLLTRKPRQDGRLWLSERETFAQLSAAAFVPVRLTSGALLSEPEVEAQLPALAALLEAGAC